MDVNVFASIYAVCCVVADTGQAVGVNVFASIYAVCCVVADIGQAVGVNVFASIYAVCCVVADTGRAVGVNVFAIIDEKGRRQGEQENELPATAIRFVIDQSACQPPEER